MCSSDLACAVRIGDVLQREIEATHVGNTAVQNKRGAQGARLKVDIWDNKVSTAISIARNGWGGKLPNEMTLGQPVDWVTDI